MRRFLGDRTRAEPSLRLWLFVGLCGVLSTLLLVALALDGTHSRSFGRTNTSGLTPVFLPKWPMEMLTWRAPSPLTEEEGDETDRPTMRLVETLPVGDFQLNSTLEATHTALLRHTQQATRSIDMSAMYWNLLGADDRKVYSPEDMTRFGADRGTQLFQALLDAVQRGVTLRIITAGDGINSTTQSQLPDEVETLRKAAPDRVLVRTWSGKPWFGGGILHQKMWLFDQRHVYIGSANMDWKSLAQVMEMGIIVEDLKPEHHLLQDVQRLFDVWWLWGNLDASTQVTTYFSNRFQAILKVPAWSRHVPHASRAPDPFVDAGLEAHGNVLNQIKTSLADGSYANVFVASSPAESTARATRTFDEDALVYTIETAQKRLSLSVMDFTPYEMYGLETHSNASIWWPALADPILAGVFGKKGLHVRLLISQWQSTKRVMLDALKMLQQQAQLCKYMQCGGSLEIKIFRVPGWQNTTTKAKTATPPLWPAFTRVNHAKYIVSDTRVNIGTSNMAWGYFYTTAGISVNTDHGATRAAMEDVFNRNWASPYAVPLSSVMDSQQEEEEG